MKEHPLSPADPSFAALAARVGASEPATMFLSAHWLRAAATAWTDRADVSLRDVGNGFDEPGWAIVGRHTERRHRLLRSRVLNLNASGVPSLDIVFPEYNGFFGLPPARFEAAFERLLTELLAARDWDEFRLPGLATEHAQAAARVAARRGIHCATDTTRTGFDIDLASIRAAGKSYVETRSANTRQQLRRARRQLEAALGPLALQEADSAASALAWFEACAPLHRRRWAESGSGFDSLAFVEFHRALIEDAFGAGAIQFLRVLAGERPIAYLYNFRLKGDVAFYLSAIDYELGDAFRPGMLAHWLAIEHNLAQGLSRYDFMTGESRYKRSLAAGHYEQHWLTLQRPRVKLLAERTLRSCVRRWRAYRAKAAPPTPA